MSTEEQDYKLPQVNPQGITSDDALQTLQGDDGVNAPDPTTQIQSAMSDIDDSMSAEDLDLIEKAWVEKAKTIVKKTQGNPHAQIELMSRMKADYMKKRYNRDIKVSE